MKEDIVFVPVAPPNSPYRIEYAGITYEDPKYRIVRNHDGVCVIEYVISGKGYIETDGKKYEVEEGDLYIIPPDNSHIYYSDAKNPWKKIWFNSIGPLCNEMIRLYNPENKLIFKGTETYFYFEKMLDLCKNKSLSVDEFTKQATLIFTEIFLNLNNRFDSNRFYSREAKILREYIDRNFKNNISIEFLSSLIYRSKSQTIRIFTSAYNCTPYDYILNQKFKYAKHLLKSTNLRIKDVAFELGFCDEHYFSYLFKKRCGLNPKEYRNGILL